MLQVVISILAFLVAIALLVAVHEFGHFWVARRFGIKVLRFSIGFGAPLFRWYDKLGTEYVIARWPLGGYVSLFGERDKAIPVGERHLAFGYKSVWVRIAVLLAGPFFNLGFAVLAYWVTFLMGISVAIPLLGNIAPDSIAGLAGLHKNQEIVAVEGIKTPSWEEVSVQLLSHIGEEPKIKIVVQEGAKGLLETKTLDLTHWDEKTSEGNFLEALGLQPFDFIPPVIETVLPGLPAEKAGVKPGDRIVRVNNMPTDSTVDVSHIIQPNAGKKVTLEILRAGETVKLEIEPVLKQYEGGKEAGFMGVEFKPLEDYPPAFVRTERMGPVHALNLALQRTYEYSILTLSVLKKMVMGSVSSRHISGPIAIAKYAGLTVTQGFKQFLNFLAMISISLGVLNLLPIPILDGGHILFCAFEAIKGSAVSETTQRVGFLMGGVLLIGLMLLAFYNDLSLLF